MQRRASPKTDADRPPPIRMYDGDGRECLVGRRNALHLAGRLFCPNHHHIGDSLTQLEEDTFRCRHNVAESQSPCGSLLYVLAGMHARDGTELTHASEVTFDEIRRMRQMSIAQKLHFLNLTWARER